MTRVLAAVALLLSACTGAQDAPATSSLPVRQIGEFVDDYGIRYTIGLYAWTQHPNATYHITDWNVDRQVAVAQNDADNTSDAGLWTRIDWIRLDGTGEYSWAFCYAVYDAATRPEAITAAPSGHDTPRTGCNGYPFSRMKRVDAG